MGTPHNIPESDDPPPNHTLPSNPGPGPKIGSQLISEEYIGQLEFSFEMSDIIAAFKSDTVQSYLGCHSPCETN